MGERRPRRDPGEQDRIGAAQTVRVIIEAPGGGIVEDAVVGVLRDAAMDEGVGAQRALAPLEPEGSK